MFLLFQATAEFVSSLSNILVKPIWSLNQNPSTGDHPPIEGSSTVAAYAVLSFLESIIKDPVFKGDNHQEDH
jgi:hypothetical protein